MSPILQRAFVFSIALTPYFCGAQQVPSPALTVAHSSLKDAFKNYFLIGVAVNSSEIRDQNAVCAEIIKTQFDSITPENEMKWQSIHPLPDKYNFGPADQYVAFGESNGMFIIGHTLVWHSQIPDWVFKDANGKSASRETLLARMREHIQTVAGRYRGRVKGWDVVNEALAGDGSLRDSPWRKGIGDDYIAKAFEFAHEADPEAELYYNDYGLESDAKRRGAISLLSKLMASGVPVTGVGIQEHVSPAWPSVQDLDKTIAAFGNLGLKVMITELDVDVLPAARSHKAGEADINQNEAADPSLNPYVGGLPKAVQEAQARRYADLFAMYLKHRNTISRVTLWGVTDGDSWLNNFPIRGRTNYPLLFDRLGHAKPDYYAVIDAARAISIPDAHELAPPPNTN